MLLGVRYMQGLGTRKDSDQGIKWIRKSSHRGCEDATRLLEAINNGTQPDKVTALCISLHSKQYALLRVLFRVLGISLHSKQSTLIWPLLDSGISIRVGGNSASLGRPGYHAQWLAR